MKKIIAASVAALALLFGSLVISAPAQAVAGSIITFNNIQDGIPKTIDLRTVRTNGQFEYTSWHERSWHVKYTCPKDSNFKIWYHNPLSKSGWLAPGECLWPIHEGNYNVGIYRANY